MYYDRAKTADCFKNIKNDCYHIFHKIFWGFCYDQEPKVWQTYKTLIQLNLIKLICRFM